MTKTDLIALLPLVIIAAASVAVMMAIAFYRNHRFTAVLTLSSLALAAAVLPSVSTTAPRFITPLVVIDNYALYYMGLIFMSGFAVAALSYSYLEQQAGHHEEFYILLLLATLGTAVLVASTHFASFFLGIEILSVSLYALAAYHRHNDRSVEAGVKYLILAGVSSAFILFGMALVYAVTGTMEFGRMTSAATPAASGLPLNAGLVLMVIGLGFKLAVVPFHLWTPDVYEGAPAPVSALIATVSKGGVFALVFRYFRSLDMQADGSLYAIITVIAVTSMFAGNLLALLQTNVKRLLAYSSISHIGYLFITLMADGSIAATAAAFYLTAYFITTLGAFGVVTLLSGRERDADSMNDYAGLAWRRPWLAGIFTLMLLSLAGMPLTAGFIAKFYIVAAGINSVLWLLVVVLVINSAIGLFYYLRLISVLYSKMEKQAGVARISLSGSWVLISLAAALVLFGIHPAPLIALIEKTIQSIL